MIKAGCANEGSDSFSEFVQECIVTGCSPKQCGLAPGTDVCNVSTPMCVNEYFQCNLEVRTRACLFVIGWAKETLASWKAVPSAGY